MTDGLAPWANLGMLVVIGGLVTLVLVAAVGPRSPVARRLGTGGAVVAFVAGIAVAPVAVASPERWWFALSGWAVWIGGEIVVFGLPALVSVVAGSRARRGA